MSIHSSLISYTIPVHKRHDDFAQALPRVVAAALASPPVQIVVVDYGEQEPLTSIIEPYYKLPIISHIHYRKRPHYHMAHARNLSLRASKGIYVTIAAADILPHEHFFATIRTRLDETQADVLRSQTDGYIGVITAKREMLMDAGGFDER